MLGHESIEGLLACYRDVTFRPVFGGCVVHTTATLQRSGRTSRELRSEARVGEDVVCSAIGSRHRRGT